MGLLKPLLLGYAHLHQVGLKKISQVQSTTTLSLRVRVGIFIR